MMDKVMLGTFCSMEQVGFYENAEKIINIPMTLITALGTVMLPRMSNLKGKQSETRILIYKSVLFAMLLSTSMSFGIMAVSKTFVPFFYGPGYDVCIQLLEIE